MPTTRSSALLSVLVPAPSKMIGISFTATKHVRNSLVNRAESASCESTVSSCSCCCSSCPASFCLEPALSEETVSADVAATLLAAAIVWYVSLACCAFLANHSSPVVQHSRSVGLPGEHVDCPAFLLYCRIASMCTSSHMTRCSQRLCCTCNLKQSQSSSGAHSLNLQALL